MSVWIPIERPYPALCDCSEGRLHYFHVIGS